MLLSTVQGPEPESHKAAPAKNGRLRGSPTLILILIPLSSIPPPLSPPSLFSDPGDPACVLLECRGSVTKQISCHHETQTLVFLLPVFPMEAYLDLCFRNRWTKLNPTLNPVLQLTLFTLKSILQITHVLHFSPLYFTLNFIVPYT